MQGNQTKGERCVMDLIDRYLIAELVDSQGNVHWADIAGLPSEQQWIPVSERLPEIGKEVLLSDHNMMIIAEYHGSGDSEGFWLVDGYHHYSTDVNRCAWMPLPEPYREDGEKG